MIYKKGNISYFSLINNKFYGEKTINDNNITSICYNEEKNLLFTGDQEGIIIKSLIKKNGSINTNDLVDRATEIRSIAINKECTLMAYSTLTMRLYLYDI